MCTYMHANQLLTYHQSLQDQSLDSSPRSASKLRFYFLQASAKEKEFKTLILMAKIHWIFYISQANNNMIRSYKMMTRLLLSYSINYYIIHNGSTYIQCCSIVFKVFLSISLKLCNFYYIEAIEIILLYSYTCVAN